VRMPGIQLKLATPAGACDRLRPRSVKNVEFKESRN
jgi:hypothetical protein